MNKRLEDAITRLKLQPEERQQEAAEILFDFLEAGQRGRLSLAGANCEKSSVRLSESEPYATMPK